MKRVTVVVIRFVEQDGWQRHLGRPKQEKRDVNERIILNKLYSIKQM